MGSEETKNKAEATEGMIDLGKLPLEEMESGVFERYKSVVNKKWTHREVRIRFADLL